MVILYWLSTLQCNIHYNWTYVKKELFLTLILHLKHFVCSSLLSYTNPSQCWGHILWSIHTNLPSRHSQYHRHDWWKLSLDRRYPQEIMLVVFFFVKFLFRWNEYLDLVTSFYIFDRVPDSHEEQQFWMTRLDLVGIRLNQFGMFEEHENCLSRWKQCCSRWKQCLMKTMYK